MGSIRRGVCRILFVGACIKRCDLPQCGSLEGALATLPIWPFGGCDASLADPRVGKASKCIAEPWGVYGE
jgi:hypothetical protein